MLAAPSPSSASSGNLRQEDRAHGAKATSLKAAQREDVFNLRQETHDNSSRQPGSGSLPLASSSDLRGKVEVIATVFLTCWWRGARLTLKSCQIGGALNPSMKTSLRRWCALFPWMHKMGSVRQGGLQMASSTELRGLGAQAWLDDTDNRYTSLRDIMPHKRKLSFLAFSEMSEPAFWRNDASFEEYGRTPKTPLLGSAAHLWLQSSVAEAYHHQGSNIFTRCWLKFTGPASSPPALKAPTSASPFRFSFADWRGYFPFLKYLDLSFAFNALLNRLRQPQQFVTLRP